MGSCVQPHLFVATPSPSFPPPLCAPPSGLLPPSSGAPSASAVAGALVDGEDEKELGPRTLPHASSTLAPSVATASMGLRLSATALVAAALASRRSDPVNPGRMMVKRSPAAVKSSVLAQPPATYASLTGTSTGQLPTLLEQVEEPQTSSS
jgi:hypothetical protein